MPITNENRIWFEANQKLKSELETYKIALNYFVKEGGQPAEDIKKNLLKELEG